MPAELLASKFCIPPLRPNRVPRPRLLKQMSDGLNAGRSLTLVSAPAGFGKTTLVVDWLEQAGLPAAWISLDEADNDLPRFVEYLAAAIQQVDEDLGASLQSAVQSQQLAAIEKGLAALLNEITARPEALILVLDDYHLLYELSILVVVESLIRHRPSRLHLVLITREDPDLPLARLRAGDQLTEIRARDLRFTREETETFLCGVMGLDLSRQDVAALDHHTEGWAAGLQLAGLSIQRQADPQAFIADFSGSHRHILDYLTGEVLQQQPESTRTFLLQTAVLDQLSASLCDAVTGRTDSDRLLAQLEAANLFVIPLDEERRWYRYHHLFSDLLRSQLTRSHPEWIPELHRRASCWYEKSGDILYAVDHALQDPDMSRAAGLIDRHVFPKLYQGHVAMVLGWYDRLPAAVLESAPMLCIGKAWALALIQRTPRQDEVELALQSAERAAGQLADQALREMVAGHAASIRAYVLQSPGASGGNPKMLIALSQEAQRLLPVNEKAIRSVNALNMGHGYQALADLEAAGLAFHQALEDGLSGGNFYAAIYGPINLIIIALLAGRLEEAFQLCETYIEQFNHLLAGQYFPPVGALHILKGSILLEGDNLADAEKALLEGLDLIQWTGEYDDHRRGYTALARLHAIREDQPAMIATLQSLEQGWPEYAIHARSLRHRLALRCRPADAQAREAARVWLSQAGIEFGKLAVTESFDPPSVAFFETYLNAAHLLASLAPDLPGAQTISEALSFLARQQASTARGGISAWFARAAIARAVLYHASGKKREALEALETALTAAAPTGLFRIFVDECDPLQGLLDELKPRLAGRSVAAYTGRLLEAMRCEPAPPERGQAQAALLSERELEVLRCLAAGLSYEETGRQLYLSLNTVQFHVKNIYRKLLVNKRIQAIEKARELKLI